jgi:hypothetical protein
MAEKKSWTVTTSADRPIRDIAKDLKKAGFTVGQVLEDIGVITGRSDDETVKKKVRSIKGVVDVSPDLPVDVGPPDSPKTW